VIVAFALLEAIFGVRQPLTLQIGRALLAVFLVPLAAWLPRIPEKIRPHAYAVVGAVIAVGITLHAWDTGGSQGQAFLFLVFAGLIVGLLFLNHPAVVGFTGIVSLACVQLLLTRENQSDFAVAVWLTSSLSTTVFAVIACVLHQRVHRADVERVRESERMLGTLLHSLPVAVLVTDETGVPLYSNPLAKNLLGNDVVCSPAPLTTLGSARVLGSDQPYPPERAPVVRALHGEANTVADMQIVTGEQTVPVQVHASPIKDAAGRLTYVVATFTDLSQRLQAEAELQAAQKRESDSRTQLSMADRMSSLGTLAAGVVHEINNPLAFVIANLQFAADTLTPQTHGEDVCAAIADAHHGANRVRDIVRDLKLFSRADDTTPGPVDVEAIVRSALNMAWNELRHRARLVTHFEKVPAVLGSESKLGQVFLNLIINAVQALPEREASLNQIVVRVTNEAGERVRIEVEDNGAGMTPDVQLRIFEPFYTTKPRGIGTGLGLAICHGIVTQHKGEILLSSRPGKGSTFTITLPATTVSTDQHTAVASTGRVRTTQVPRSRIVVLDDEPLICSMFVRSLKHEHEVKSFTNGHAAVEWFRAGNTCDVVFCDLMMPTMSGMDFYAELKRTNPELLSRIVFMTGGAFTSAANDFLAGVSNQTIGKPCEKDAIAGAIDRVAGVALTREQKREGWDSFS
jgi:signal transduction histidine kinase/ActR/RegA family two-component response regulator